MSEREGSELPAPSLPSSQWSPPCLLRLSGFEWNLVDEVEASGFEWLWSGQVVESTDWC